jgi:hypothetical protein
LKFADIFPNININKYTPTPTHKAFIKNVLNISLTITHPGAFPCISGSENPNAEGAIIKNTNKKVPIASTVK